MSLIAMYLLQTELIDRSYLYINREHWSLGLVQTCV